MVLALEAWNRNTITAWALSQYKDHLSRYGDFRYKDDMAVRPYCLYHYGDVTMGAIASQITSLTIVYSIVYSDAEQRTHQKLRVTGLCVGNSPGTGEFPAQMASNAENVSIWWRHHDNGNPCSGKTASWYWDGPRGVHYIDIVWDLPPDFM